MKLILKKFRKDEKKLNQLSAVLRIRVKMDPVLPSKKVGYESYRKTLIYTRQSKINLKMILGYWIKTTMTTDIKKSFQTKSKFNPTENHIQIITFQKLVSTNLQFKKKHFSDPSIVETK